MSVYVVVAVVSVSVVVVVCTRVGVRVCRLLYSLLIATLSDGVLVVIARVPTSTLGTCQ